MKRPTLLAASLLAAASLCLMPLANAGQGPGHGNGHGNGHGHGGGHGGGHDKDRVVRFSTFNASLNRIDRRPAGHRPVHAGQRAGQQRGRDDPAGAPRRAADQRVRLRARGRRPVPRQLPRGRAQRRRADRLPLRLHRAVQHRRPERLRPQQQRRRGAPGTQAGGDDSCGFGFFEGQFGMVVYSKYPIDTDDVRTFQNFKWKDMPGALLPDDPATAAPADWYSPEELAGVPALLQVALGRADQDRQEDGALPGLAPDAAHLRRARGPQRHPQPRRDPVLGRLRVLLAPRIGVHL